LERLSRFAVGPIFTPPAAGKTDGILGALQLGIDVVNWPGSAYDPETHVLYTEANNSGLATWSVTRAPSWSEVPYVMGVEGDQVREMLGSALPRQTTASPPNANTATSEASASPASPASPARPSPIGDSGVYIRDIDGIPLVKPPYGVVTAINMDQGAILWQVPYGQTPDAVASSPALKGLTIPNTGQPGQSSGVLVTKTLIVVGDKLPTSLGHPRGAMLRAHDKHSGAEVGAVWMPAPQTGSPMTYQSGGRQYIVVAVGGGNVPGEYLAFRLPRATTQ
jgi:quinoprotein glucose dehydrogenase